LRQKTCGLSFRAPVSIQQTTQNKKLEKGEDLAGELLLLHAHAIKPAAAAVGHRDMHNTGNVTLPQSHNINHIEAMR
jgi:hypothetical protein